jgi:hypothetical protein
MRRQVGQCDETLERAAAEELAPKVVADTGPHQTARDYAGKKASEGQSRPSDDSHIALRASSAWAIVTPSAYSRSPPTGSPRAMRDTVSG